MHRSDKVGPEGWRWHFKVRVLSCKQIDRGRIIVQCNTKSESDVVKTVLPPFAFPPSPSKAAPKPKCYREE